MSKKADNKKEAKTTEEVEETPAIVTSWVDDIKVEIDRETYEKIMYWVDRASGEVSGLGKVEMVDGIFRVTSAVILKQKNTGVTTELDAASVSKAMFELKDEPGHLNFWWHSHVDMDVFWSGTDIQTIHELGKHGWFLATVFNKRREMRSAYYQKGNNFMPEILVDKINTDIIFMADEDKFAEWDKEFDDKVEERKYTYGGRNSGLGKTYVWPEFDGEEEDFEAGIFDVSLSARHPGRGFVEWEDDELRELSEKELREEEEEGGYYYLDDDELDEEDFTEEHIQEMFVKEAARQEQEKKKQNKRGKNARNRKS